MRYVPGYVKREFWYHLGAAVAVWTFLVVLYVVAEVAHG